MLLRLREPINKDGQLENDCRFQTDREAIEIRLVHALELAVSKCNTLSTVCDILVAFKHLYPRPALASVIDSITNQVPPSSYCLLKFFGLL